MPHDLIKAKVLSLVKWCFNRESKTYLCTSDKAGFLATRSMTRTKCAQLIADLFLFCYEKDFMSNLHKSKQYDLVDMFYDTPRYLDDIFTIDNPEFEKHIPDMYPTDLQLNKANTSDKETSFLDLNIKGIGSDVHTSVYDKRDDFGFPIVNFPWLSGDVPRLPSYVSQLVRFAR